MAPSDVIGVTSLSRVDFWYCLSKLLRESLQPALPITHNLHTPKPHRAILYSSRTLIRDLSLPAVRPIDSSYSSHLTSSTPKMFARSAFRACQSAQPLKHVSFVVGPGELGTSAIADLFSLLSSKPAATPPSLLHPLVVATAPSSTSSVVVPSPPAATGT